MRKYKPTAKSYFSGAGGLDVGVMQSGVKVIQSLDLDRRATKFMNANSHYFGHNVLNCSITDMEVLTQPKSDIMMFTYPCTKYSTIADIHGARTGDELFLHAFRHIALELPEMFVVENVPGMKKFKIVMEAMTQIPGYYMNVFCPVDASNWLPQRRERLILIGTKKPFDIKAPTRQRNVRPIKDILEKRPTVEIPDYVVSRIEGKYRDRPIIIDPSDPSAIAPTCVAHYSKDLGTRLVVDRKFKNNLRPFSIREYARLQGFPDDLIFPMERYSYMLIGNAVAVPVGRWIGAQAMKYFN